MENKSFFVKDKQVCSMVDYVLSGKDKQNFLKHKSKSKKVAAVVVTYNRKECLKKCLDALGRQSHLPDCIIVIDNHSNDGTDIFLKKYIEKKKLVVVYRLKENIGGAGGFSFGIKTAVDLGFDYVWGMDDDAIPDKDSLRNLSLVVDPNRNNCFWSNCNKDDDFPVGEMKEVNNWMFVGFFVPSDVVKRVGLPRSDFFIYYDDAEYARRIIKNGYKIKKIKGSIINHKDNVGNKIVRKFLWWNVSIPSLPDWKMYYFIRNFILMYKWSDLYKYKIILCLMPSLFFKILVCSRSQLPIFMKAYVHGIFGVSGKKEEPR